MRSYDTGIAVIVICMSFTVATLAIESKPSDRDTVSGSRWARVDLTQYCGRTVGELLDTLGNDYEECWCNSGGCRFSYVDGAIELGPHTYKYCHLEGKDTFLGCNPANEDCPWKVDDYRKETIDHISIDMLRKPERLISKGEDSATKRKGFVLDYAGYIGGTLDSMVKDIGYPCASSRAYKEAGKYFRFTFLYPNGVEIEALLESLVSVPPKVSASNLIDDYALQQRIGWLGVTIRCPNGCEGVIGGERDTNVTGILRGPEREGRAEKDVKGVIIKNVDGILELIWRTNRYNVSRYNTKIGALAILQPRLSSISLDYIYAINGRDGEVGINPGRYTDYNDVVATIHTHDDCAVPSPADVYAFAQGAWGPVAIIVGINDNSLSIMQYSDVKTARSYAMANSRAAIADKCRDPLNPTPSCDRRLELIRGFFDMENTGVDYMYVTDWREWIK